MMRSAVLLFILAIQFGSSKQACQECECCNGENACDSDGKCTNGCKPGYYSTKCVKTCGKGCLNNTCDGLNGSCTCKSNDFVEGTCEFCVNGKYGEDCNQTCPSNCNYCSSGTVCSLCKHGLYYGSYCQYRCSLGCNPGPCNKKDGNCSTCKSGFYGDKCDICTPGVYGKYCDLKCLDNCSSCISGTNCTECNDGFYGETCSFSCPTGCKGNCSVSDSRCFDCKPGFYGEFCNITCIDGTFGYNCSKFCNDTDTSCRVCGADASGQYAGCTQCKIGRYLITSPGENYSTCENCPFNCRGNECNTLGFCSNGCIKGYTGPDCNQATTPGPEGYSTGALIGSSFGSGLVGIFIGVTFMLAISIWRRIQRNNIQSDVESERTTVPNESRTTDHTYDSGAIVEYEDLKSRDNRMYSQLTSNELEATQAAEYVEFN